MGAQSRVNREEWRRHEKERLEEATHQLFHEEWRGGKRTIDGVRIDEANGLRFSGVESMGRREKEEKERKLLAKSRQLHEDVVMDKIAYGYSMDELDAVQKGSDGRTDYEVAREFFDGTSDGKVPPKNKLRIVKSDEYGVSLSDGRWISRDAPEFRRLIDGLLQEEVGGMDFVEVGGDIRTSGYYGIGDDGHVELLDGFGDGYGYKVKEFDSATAEENSYAAVKTEFSGTVDVTMPDAIYMRLVKAVQELGKDGLEVGGLLKMDIVDGKLTVTDYNLLPQEVGGADFEIKEPAMAAWMLEHLEDPEFPKWRAWWHSHHRMGLFWSGTDDDQFKKLLEGGGQYRDTFGIVFVNSGDFLARYDVKTQFGIVSVDHLSVKILRAGAIDEKKIEEEMKQVITENVKKPKYESLDYSYESREAFEKYSDIRVADVLLENCSLWDDITMPYDAEDILKLAQMHRKSKLWKRWSLEFECMVWGIDDRKLRREMKKVDDELRAERKAQGKRGRKKKQQYNMWGDVL